MEDYLHEYPRAGEPQLMDEYLDMLIEDSSKAAKATLIYSMFPLYTKDSKRVVPALKSLDADVLDTAIGLLATASRKQLDYVHYALKLSAVSSTHDNRSALLYSASFASLQEAFTGPDANYLDWYMELRKVYEFMSQCKDAMDIHTEVSIARGALIALKTNTFTPLAETAGLQWLGDKHDDILKIAPSLLERQTSDPFVIQQLVEETHAALNHGVL